MSTFCFCQKMAFMTKIVSHSKQYYESCVWDFSVFVKQNITINENVSFIYHATGIHLPDGCEMALNRKKDNGVTIYQNDVIVNFLIFPCFSCLVYLLVLVSCQYPDWFWSYDHFLLKGLTRNPEIGNTLVWLLPSI